MPNIISGFHEKYQFLSNFYNTPVTYDGITYASNESAFQGAKFLHLTPAEAAHAIGPDLMAKYKLNENDPLLIPHFFMQLLPNEAKKFGRKLPLDPNWENKKVGIMRDLVYAKFTQNENLQRRLKATYPATLVETNWWHDNIWGDCNCNKCKHITGKNILGNILMEVREKFL